MCLSEPPAFCIPHIILSMFRCCVREGESRSEHLHKQLQLAHQRRTLLIDELEHNQLSIEQAYESRLRLELECFIFILWTFVIG